MREPAAALTNTYVSEVARAAGALRKVYIRRIERGGRSFMKGLSLES